MVTRVTDLFCGAGGSSTGARDAGARVVAAINHWSVAIDTHTANHPETHHVCQDATLMDPRDLPAFDLLIAEPACQGHSKARGKDRPHHDKSRATAWCVVNTLEVTRVRDFVIENVPAMRRWALYEFWLGSLRALGYTMAEHVINAADCGVPQDRERLIVVGRLGRRAPRLEMPRMPRPPASTFVRFDDEMRWTPVAGHVPATLARIAQAQRDHGPRVLVPYYSSARGGRSIDRPIGTLTTRDRYAVVDGDRMRMLSIPEMQHAMGFAPGYVLTGSPKEQCMQLGNAVAPPMMRHVLESAFGISAGRRAVA